MRLKSLISASHAAGFAMVNPEDPALSSAKDRHVETHDGSNPIEPKRAFTPPPAHGHRILPKRKKAARRPNDLKSWLSTLIWGGQAAT